MSKQKLTLSPLAYLHWKFLCHKTEIEATAFGVPAADNPLYVERLWVPEQIGDVCSTDPAPGSIGEFLMWADDEGYERVGLGSLWFHTHPDIGARPSSIDEATFRETFGPANCQWAVMAILAEGGEMSARLRIHKPRQVDVDLIIEVDWDSLPKYADEIARALPGWGSEYDLKVKKAEREPVIPSHTISERDWRSRVNPSVLTSEAGGDADDFLGEMVRFTVKGGKVVEGLVTEIDDDGDLGVLGKDNVEYKVPTEWATIIEEDEDGDVLSPKDYEGELVEFEDGDGDREIGRVERADGDLLEIECNGTTYYVNVEDVQLVDMDLYYNLQDKEDQWLKAY